MTLVQIKKALETVGIPVTYYEWEYGAPNLPYMAYFEDGAAHVAADDSVYTTVSTVAVELYTKKRDRQLEKKLENALDKIGAVWQKSGAEKIEHAFLTQYTFEDIINDSERELENEQEEQN